MLLVVPSALLVLLRYVFDGEPGAFNRVGAPLLGVFPFVTMFLVTSVAMLRERTTGTLERLLTTRLAKLDLLLGYALTFTATALAQVAIASTIAFGPLGLDNTGIGWVVLLAMASALLGTAMGLLVSAFAATEFQAVQFLPAVVLPQFLLCGLLVPRDRMPDVLRWASDVMPLSYAVDGMGRAATSPVHEGSMLDLSVMLACVVAALILGAATLRRRTE
jgi:ABC-2 type transport system permease protein